MKEWKKEYTLKELYDRVKELMEKYEHDQDMIVVVCKNADSTHDNYEKLEGVVGYIGYCPDLKTGELTVLDDFECSERPNVISLN